MIVYLVFLLLIGVPVGIAFSLVIVTRADAWNIVVDFVSQTTLDALLNYPFLAIPLFMLGGELMTRGGLTRQLVAISQRVLGWTHAPLGHIMIGASALMGAITGSSVAAVAAIGRAIGPEMIERGYLPGYVGALNASAGLLGVLLPPSIPLILYGSAVGVSITQLFMATLVPGILFLVAFMIVHSLRARRVLKGGTSARWTGLRQVSWGTAKFLPRYRRCSCRFSFWAASILAFSRRQRQLPSQHSTHSPTWFSIAEAGRPMSARPSCAQP
jgi:C4-dicarboxylate transporter, DctM subunit